MSDIFAHILNYKQKQKEGCNCQFCQQAKMEKGINRILLKHSEINKYHQSSTYKRSLLE